MSTMSNCCLKCGMLLMTGGCFQCGPGPQGPASGGTAMPREYGVNPFSQAATEDCVADLSRRLLRAETIIAVMQRALGVQIFEDAIGTYRIALTGVRRTETHNQSLTDDERKILEES